MPASLISKVQDRIQFDAFELSALNEAVMTTKGRLRRSFPGSSVSLSLNEFQQAGFRPTVAHTLSEMSSDAVVDMQPQARKAGKDHDEDRDTTHPGMVTELFMGFVRSIGQAVAVPTISKNTRDEVLLKDARSPWRRSAKWLLIRVALRLTLARTAAVGNLYKEAMLFLMGHMSKLVREVSFPSDVLYAVNAKLVRRVLKISSNMDTNALARVQDMIRETHKNIADRWSAIQQQDAQRLNLSKLAELDFESDQALSIPALDAHINGLRARKPSKASRNFVPASHLLEYQPDSLPSPPRYNYSDNDYAIADLEAFEEWVALHCQQWSLAHAWDPSTCSALGSLMTAYNSLSPNTITPGTQRLSQSCCWTVFELWMACDKVAVSLHPLLKEYNPGVPQDVLQNLLLPSKQQMERLRILEQYLTDRREVRYPSSKIYRDLDSPDLASPRDISTSLLCIRLRSSRL